MIVASSHLSEYADHVVDQLSAGWQARALTAARAGGQRRACIRAMLRGERVDDKVLGHPLDRWHVALAVPSTHPSGLSSVLVRQLRARHRDAAVLLGEDIEGVDIIWLTTPDRNEPETVARSCAGLPAGGAAVGVSGAAYGAEGIAVTGHEARAAGAAAVGRAVGPVLLRDVAVRVALAQDPARSRRLAEVVLGPLSGGGEEAARLRQTLRAYYACGSNKTATGARLHLHEKTVAYRLRAVARAVGCSVDEGRLNLEAALLVIAD